MDPLTFLLGLFIIKGHTCQLKSWQTGHPLLISSVPWMADLTSRSHTLKRDPIGYPLIKTYPSLLVSEQYQLNKGPGLFCALRSCPLCSPAVGLKKAPKHRVLLRAGSEAELTGAYSNEALDLGLISFILLPTRLTTANTAPLGSIAPYSACGGTSVFAWFDSCSQNKAAFSTDELLRLRTRHTHLLMSQIRPRTEEGGFVIW